MYNLIFLRDHVFAVGIETRQANVSIAHLKGVACCEMPISVLKAFLQDAVCISHVVAASKDGVYEAILR